MIVDKNEGRGMVAHKTALVTLCVTNFLIALADPKSIINILATGLEYTQPKALILTTVFVILYGILYFWRWYLEYDWFEFSKFSQSKKIRKTLVASNKKIGTFLEENLETIRLEAKKENGFVVEKYTELQNAANTMDHFFMAFQNTYKIKACHSKRYHFIATAGLPAIAFGASIGASWAVLYPNYNFMLFIVGSL